MSQNSIARNQRILLGGCVPEWAKTVRDVNRLVVYPGRLFSTTLSPHGNPPSLFSWLLVTICSERAKGGYPNIAHTSYRTLKVDTWINLVLLLV